LMALYGIREYYDAKEVHRKTLENDSIQSHKIRILQMLHRND